MLNIGWTRPPAPWQGIHAAHMPHALAVEGALAIVRVVLVAVSLVVAVLGHAWPFGLAATAVLLGLAVYSLALAVALRRRLVTSPRHVSVFHAIDTAGILAALFLTGGAVSPFSTMFLFVLLAAGYRWGRPETWRTAAVGILVLALEPVAAYAWGWSPMPDLHIVGLRLAYLGLGGALIGYMAEIERIYRHRAWAVSDILSLVRIEGGLVAAVQAVLGELLVQFRASHAVVVLEEEGHDRVSIWQADRSESEPRSAAVRLNLQRREEAATYLFPVPRSAAAWQVRRRQSGSAPGEAVLMALDAGGARTSEPFSVSQLFQAPFPWVTALCVSTISGEGWSGRVFLFLPFSPQAPREQLRFLQYVVHGTAPAIFNLYLQRRLQSRTGVVERARISRELHDGVIQSLIGVEMQLEVARREGAGRLPGTIESQLTGIQQVLRQEILDVRDLMQFLKPADVDARRLVEYLADTVEQFRHRTGIDAHLACDEDEVDLSPRVCRELAAVVQEALANVRKHSGATNVVVRLQAKDGGWQLVVDDNGRGLGFEGYLTHEELVSRRTGPAIIMERVRSIGGRLDIHSEPGFGTRLEITVPRKHHA